MLEQPRPELEVSRRFEEEACVLSVQPLGMVWYGAPPTPFAKRENQSCLAHLANGEHIIVCRVELGRLDAVLAEDRLERLHGSLDDKEEQDGSQPVPLLDAHC
jgi:hypothetical protein